MPATESPSARYRRLARECITAARTIATEQRTQATLMEVAQVWIRLAESYDARTVTQRQPKGP
jgi:hypothetical protein